MIQRLKSFRLSLLICLLLAGACSTSPVSQFYLLAPLSDTVPRSNPEKLIVVGPINFPKYLDRPHIMTRSSNTGVRFSDVHRWAEPVQDNFTRVLAENLSRLLGTDRISIAPSRDRTSADYIISMEVLRFDASDNGDVSLTAYWNIHARDIITPVASGKADYSLSATGNRDHAQMVNVMSQAIAQLSHELAAVIQGL